jgi:hypothetical protein
MTFKHNLSKRIQTAVNQHRGGSYKLILDEIHIEDLSYIDCATEEFELGSEVCPCCLGAYSVSISSCRELQLSDFYCTDCGLHLQYKIPENILGYALKEVTTKVLSQVNKEISKRDK